jgi:PAS domain S-box-containing protein
LAWTRILGYTEGELAGMHFLDITDDADAEKTAAGYRDAWSATGEPVVLVKRYRHRDGRTIWGRIQIVAIKGDQGDSRGFIVFLEDWTDRKREGDRLIETVSFLETAQKFGGVGTFVAWISGEKAGLDEWSQACSEIFGYANGEHDGTNAAFWRRVHPDDIELVRAAQSGLAVGGRHYDLSHRIVRPNGEVRWIRERAEVEPGADGLPLRFLGVTLDITDERRTEEALRASEARFKGTFESSGIGAVVMSTDGKWLRVNDALARILDATKDRLVGCSMDDFAFPEDRRLLPSVAAMIAEDRDVETFTIRLRHPIGHPIWVILHLSIVRKADTSPDYVLAQIQDISAQRLAEARLQEARIEAESTARVAATMNHEVRGPLNSIVGFTEMIQSGMAGPLTEKQTRYLNHVLTASRAILELIAESLDISRMAAGRMEIDIVSLDLRSTLESALDQVAPLAAAKGSGLVLICSPGLAALADARRLNQILANLLANAVKHTPVGTSITLRGVANRDRVEVSVRDTGPGIRPEDLAVLFQEFVQVGDDRSGSGLGLAVSRKLALLMNGDLAATSRIGSGSIFTIDLPRPSSAGIETRP